MPLFPLSSKGKDNSRSIFSLTFWRLEDAKRHPLAVAAILRKDCIEFIIPNASPTIPIAILIDR
jgi:hypothetical protein